MKWTHYISIKKMVNHKIILINLIPKEQTAHSALLLRKKTLCQPNYFLTDLICRYAQHAVLKNCAII